MIWICTYLCLVGSNPPLYITHGMKSCPKEKLEWLFQSEKALDTKPYYCQLVTRYKK